MTPAVSVILPALNRADYLPRSVGSVLNQSFADLELLVVDDGSEPSLRDAVAAFGDSRVRYLRRERRGGVAAARNLGIREARGQWLAFQDSDDEWLPGKLQAQLDAAIPGRTMVVCGVLRVRGHGVSRYPSPFPEQGRLTHSYVLSHPYAYCQSWLVRREALLAEVGFDERMRNWSDWEMLIRLSRRIAVHSIPELLVVSCQAPDSLTVINPAWVEAIRHILDKHAEELAAHPAERAELQYAYARLLATAGRLHEARRELVRNLRARPSHWKSAALLAVTMGGPAVVDRTLAARSGA